MARIGALAEPESERPPGEIETHGRRTLTTRANAPSEIATSEIVSGLGEIAAGRPAERGNGSAAQKNEGVGEHVRTEISPEHLPKQSVRETAGSSPATNEELLNSSA